MFDDLNRKLKSGEITVAEWESEVRARLAALYLAALFLLTGGSPTAEEYALLASALIIQYGYLDGFSDDISKDPAAWLTGRLDARLALYIAASYAAYELFRQLLMIDDGFTEERRVLGVADHCRNDVKRGTTGCIELASRGWKPIGTLPKIGDATCRSNCKCSFEYRKPRPGGGWVYEKDL